MPVPTATVATKKAARGATNVPTPSFDVTTHHLDNGLTVVLSPDKAAPSVAVVAAYDVGFRSEPQGWTGFAHLFEHLMFQGSHSLERGVHGELVQRNGGTLNGFTRPDVTVYYEELPAHALELGIYLEADRMRSPRITPENLQNQIDVVKEEIKVNVMNAPYGGFPWILMPPVIFDDFNNSHNGYGSFVDLDSASIEQASTFFQQYYAPGNATLVIAGAFDPAHALELVKAHFGDIPARPTPKLPSFAEPLLTSQRRHVHTDPMAPFPALAIGYRCPDPIANLDGALALGFALDVLTEGQASRLHQRLVSRDHLAIQVGGQMGIFGDVYDYRDPIPVHILAFHPGGPADAVIAAVDEEIAIVAAGVTEDDVSPVRIANIAGVLRRVDGITGRATLLARLQMLRGDASLINSLTLDYAAITPEDVSGAAATWLTPDARAILEVVPAAAEGADQ